MVLGKILRGRIHGNLHKDRSNLIYYEILCEPHGIADAVWHNIQQQAIDTIEGKFKDKPLIEVSIRKKLGWTCWELGELKQAE